MAHLSAQQLATLESALQQRQLQLQQRLAEHHGGLSRAEHAHALLAQESQDARLLENERERDMAQSDRDTLDLAITSAALQRLHAGPYGRCSDCDEDIPFARLKAEPWAQRCVACESQREAAARRGL